MDKVTISNLQGENGLVNVVRFFLNNGNEYLIYSLKNQFRNLKIIYL